MRAASHEGAIDSGCMEEELGVQCAEPSEPRKNAANVPMVSKGKCNNRSKKQNGLHSHQENSRALS